MGKNSISQCKQIQHSYTIAFAYSIVFATVSIYGYEEGNNIVDVFINFYRESNKEEKEDKNYMEKYRLLYDALFEVIKDAVKPYCFGFGDYELKDNFNKVLETLISSSYWEWNLNKDSMVYAESLEQLKNKIDNM